MTLKDFLKVVSVKSCEEFRLLDGTNDIDCSLDMMGYFCNFTEFTSMEITRVDIWSDTKGSQMCVIAFDTDILEETVNAMNESYDKEYSGIVEKMKGLTDFPDWVQ